MSRSGLSRAGRLLVTSFGLGDMRPASGTFGSLPPVLLAAAMIFAGAPWWAVSATLLVVLVVFAAACVLYGDAAEAHFNEKDPGSVVADETAGMCLPLLLLPLDHASSAWRVVLILAIAFVLFRVLDIIKPWPARGLQRLPSGWGVLIDDLVVGVMAMVVMQVVVRV